MERYYVTIINTEDKVLFNNELSTLKFDELGDEYIGVIELKKRYGKNDNFVSTTAVFYNNEYYKYEEFKGLNNPYKMVLNDKKLYDFTNVDYVKGSNSSGMESIVKYLTNYEYNNAMKKILKK